MFSHRHLQSLGSVLLGLAQQAIATIKLTFSVDLPNLPPSAVHPFSAPSHSATNIRTSIVLDEKTNEIVINGHKWWISGAGDPRNKIHLVMGKSYVGFSFLPAHSCYVCELLTDGQVHRDPKASKYKQQSIVLVPSDTPGVKLVRPMQVVRVSSSEYLLPLFCFGTPKSSSEALS